DVVAFLSARAQAAVEAGIPEAQICLDPGFGFGKSLAHNLVLMRRLSEMCGMGYPVLVGVSRKSMIGQITGREVDARLAGGLALATWALLQGAAILRVHDVAETVDVVRVVEALKRDRE
ncbi:MAG: dihydropteroate synthase, partial [Gammaproteobacteria bacterium]|nr:dihydropteroate synthase [Gammaproteobacteria bacterium]